VEDPLRRHRGGQLDKETPLAEKDAQRVEDLHPREVFLAQVVVGERRAAKIDECACQPSAAEAARGSRAGWRWIAGGMSCMGLPVSSLPVGRASRCHRVVQNSSRSTRPAVIRCCNCFTRVNARLSKTARVSPIRSKS